MTVKTVDPVERMMDLILGYCRSQGIGTIARMGIPDMLEDGPRSVGELADEVGADEDALYRLMRALVSEGIFEEQRGRVFKLNSMARSLTTDDPRSVRWLAAAMCDSAHWKPWGLAYEAIMEGKSQTPGVLGMSPWEYLSGKPDEAGRFGLAMSNMSKQASSSITAAYDFEEFEHIVDVGGNQGTLLLDILLANPGPRGTIFDLPEVIEVARRGLEGNPLADRIDFAAGDFFKSVPAGADVYLLKHILHDWPDRECRRILERIREAIPDHGRLLVFDALLVPEAPPWAHWLDVHMMVLQDGKERSPAEFKALFEATGFHLARVIEIPSPVGILEATPA